MPQVLRAPRTASVRAFVGGFLYIEGIIVLLLGSSLLVSYWPPYPHDGEPRNPISFVGLVICLAAVTYMFSVGVGFFIYNLLHPGRDEREDPVRKRALRYRESTKEDYLFDDTIECEADADEAFIARQIY
jgi:hypothetical protein